MAGKVHNYSADKVITLLVDAADNNWSIRELIYDGFRGYANYSHEELFEELLEVLWDQFPRGDYVVMFDNDGNVLFQDKIGGRDTLNSVAG